MSQKAIEVKEKFGTYEQFAIRYSPSMQRELKIRRMDYAECYKSKFPLMSHLGAAYTDEGILIWLKIQLDNLNDFVGVKEKLNDNQIAELADIIYFDYYFLNIAEIALFFSKYKTGKFGEFYGVVDPLKITSALLEFNKQRLLEIIRVDREEKAIADNLAYEERKLTAITREEHLMRKRNKRLSLMKMFFRNRQYGKTPRNI